VQAENKKYCVCTRKAN